jgi:hypothetical protein
VPGVCGSYGILSLPMFIQVTGEAGFSVMPRAQNAWLDHSRGRLGGAESTYPVNRQISVLHGRNSHKDSLATVHVHTACALVHVYSTYMIMRKGVAMGAEVAHLPGQSSTNSVPGSKASLRPFLLHYGLCKTLSTHSWGETLVVQG